MVAARAHALLLITQEDPTNAEALIAVPHPTVTVYNPGTTTPLSVAMYRDISGGPTLSNPLTGDADGNVEFYLTTGQRVKIVATSSSGTITQDEIEVVWDPGDVATVVAMQAGDAATLSTAETYADVHDAITLTAAEAFATSADTAILALAYAHDAAVGLPWVDPTSYGAVLDGKRVLDGAMTVGDNHLSSASANFTLADVGKNLDVQNAGNSAVAGGHLRTYILAWNNANLVVTGHSAVRTVTGAIGQWGTDNTTAFNTALAVLRTAGGGTLKIPAGNAIFNTSINLHDNPAPHGTPFSNVTVEGAGIGLTQLWAGSGIDASGTDQYLTSDLISGLYSATVQTADNYQKNITIRNMTLDCSFQSNTGSGASGGFGAFNACAIQFQDTTNSIVEDCEIVGAYGNGVVFGSINPLIASAVKNCVIRRVTFRNCVRGLLMNPIYLITGSVIQIGAGKSCRIEQVQFYNSGGPLIDVFNCADCTIDDVYAEGWSGTPMGAGQVGRICTIHSDFGLTRLRVKNYTSINGGGIFTFGNMTSNAFNGNTPTPGPEECVFENISIQGTAQLATTTPSIASSTIFPNNDNFPVGVELTIPSGPTITDFQVLKPDNTVYQQVLTNRTATGTVRCVIPIGYKIVVYWTGSPAPTWAWYDVPNGQWPGIFIAAGSQMASHTITKKNVYKNVRIVRPPGSGIELYDGWWNTFEDITVEDPGFWDAAHATGISLINSFSFTQLNMIRGLDVTCSEQTLATLRTIASIYDHPNNDGAVENSIWDARIVNGLQGGITIAPTNHANLLQVLPTPGVPSTCSTNPAANTVTNPFPHNVLVKVTGTTVTDIGVNSAFTAYSAAAGPIWVYLGIGWTIALRYASGSPSWLWHHS